MLYDAAGADMLPLLGAEPEPAVVFWRAMLARASRMEEPFGAAVAAVDAGWLLCNAAMTFGGGLPGGVVEVSARNFMVRLEQGEVPCTVSRQTAEKDACGRM